MDASFRSLLLQTCLIVLCHVEFSLTDDFDVTTIYNFQRNLHTAPVTQNYLIRAGECQVGSCSWSLNGFKATSMISSPVEGYTELDTEKFNKLKLTPLSSTWQDDGIVVQVNATDDYGAVLLYLSTGNDINIMDMINMSIPFHDYLNSYGDSKFHKCINYENLTYNFQRGARQCESLKYKYMDELHYLSSKINHILIKRTVYGELQITLLEENTKMQISGNSIGDLLSKIKYIGANNKNGQMKFHLWKPMKVFALAQSQGTLETEYSSASNAGACVLIEHYLQPNSDARLTVKMIFYNNTEFLFGTVKAGTNEQENAWKTQMFVTDVDSEIFFKFRIIAEKYSDTDVFIKSIKNCPNKDDKLDRLTINRKSSVLIHARNNARGLPFISQVGDILEPNVAVDIETCTAFNNSCSWTLSNFSRFIQRPPLYLQGGNGTTLMTTISAGEEPQLRLYDNELSFTFHTTQNSGALKIYLLDSSEGFNKANMYYFTITNSNYQYDSQFYDCRNEYIYDSYISIAPGYGNRRCKLISENNWISYWESEEYTFSVSTEQRGGFLTIDSHRNAWTLFSWNEDTPLNFRYYAIGTTLTGSIKTKLVSGEQPSLVLTHTNGSIVSEAFIPIYNEVCVSVVYYRGPKGSITLQIVKSDRDKWHLKHLQTSSLGGGWVSSIYSTQLPEEKSYSPIRIELTAEAPIENLQDIVIQRIAGCNSEGLEEDIYVVSSNKMMAEMDFYAYDVAVKRSVPRYSGDELKCLNGGLFDKERDSCICPAGFTGKTCEIGCGPDRYGSKCSGHCSKTEKGCMEMRLCRPKLGCNCAPGLKGALCDITCSSGEYGASCKQKCGKCDYGTCDIYTGHCPTGCQEGFYPPFCQTRYKHLYTSPEVISTDYHTLQVTFSIGTEDLAGNGIPTFYQLQIRDPESRLNTWTEMEPISLSAAQSIETNITQLKPGTNYEVRVVLLDLDGNSYQGKDIPVANGFTKCIVPKLDYKLNTISVEQNEFQVKWEYSVENALWCKIKHFEVDMDEDWTWENHYEGTEKIFTFSNLLPGETYKVRVRGVSVNGPMPFSQPLSVTTQDEVPQIVSAPNIVSRTHNQIEVNWKKPFSPRGKIQQYKVTFKCQKLLACSDEDCSYFTGGVEVRTPSVTLQGLRPHAQYLISIAAKSAQYGPDVQILATTDMAEPEVSPSMGASTVVVRTNSTLTVQWERPENCSYLNGYLYGYQYELFEPKNPSTIYEGSTDNTSTTFVGLNPHTDYHVKVYLKTSGGKSSSHPLIINASTRATVPGKVEELTVYKMGRRILGLRWALPKETYGDIRSFTISYKSEHQTLTSFMMKPAPCIAWPNLYCHTINSLHPDTKYTVTVHARNKEVAEDGEIAQVVATTKESAPLAPDYIKTVSQNETSLNIEWGIPKLINGLLRSFLVNIEETDSVNITDCCQYFPIQEVPVQYEQANYRIQLNNLKPASTYAISVTAKTMALGPAVSITAHTRPPVPSMEGLMELVDSEESSELSISSSPKLNIHSSSINKDLLVGYLLVVIPQSASVSVQETAISNEWLAQELQQKINTTFYIAAELNQDDWKDGSGEVILGKETELKSGKWSLLWDPELENEEEYRIGLVAILDYCGILNVGYTATDVLTVNYRY